MIDKPEDNRSECALLLIDVINDLNFPGNESIIKEVPRLAKTLTSVKQAAKAHMMPVIYLNDNFNNWHSNLNELIDKCLDEDSHGKELANLLKPESNDYFVLKPMHSGFYGTPLQILLNKMKITKVILAGIAADICVLYTANDAYMRGFKISVLEDGVIANSDEERVLALNKMKNLLKAEIISSKDFISKLNN